MAALIVASQYCVYADNDYLSKNQSGGAMADSESCLHDFEARYDDTLFGRFTTMDPMAEKYYGVSPYAYCAGNPVNSIDPDGKDDFEITNLGRLLKSENDDPYDRLLCMRYKTITSCLSYIVGVINLLLLQEQAKE